jgi:hypothetical protein
LLFSDKNGITLSIIAAVNLISSGMQLYFISPRLATIALVGLASPHYASAAPPGVEGTYVVDGTAKVVVIGKDGRGHMDAAVEIRFLDDKRADCHLRFGKSTFAQPHLWKKEGSSIILEPVEQDEDEGPQPDKPRATRLRPATAAPAGWRPAGTWMMTWLKLKLDDEPQMPSQGQMRVTVATDGVIALGNGTEIGTLRPDWTLRAADQNWKLNVWEVPGDGRVIINDERTARIGMVLEKETPPAAPPVEDGPPASWAPQPLHKWPRMVLRQEAAFAGGFTVKSGAGFLWRTGEGAVAGMTARGLFDDLPGFLGQPNPEEEVRRGRKLRALFGAAEDQEFQYDLLNEKLTAWTLRASGAGEALKVTGTARRPLFLLDSDLEHLPLNVEPQKKWQVMVLDRRDTQFGYREAVRIAVPSANGQRVVSGHVFHRPGPAPFHWVGVQLDQPVEVASCIGAPALDIHGRVTGVIISSDNDDEKSPVTSFVTAQRILDVPSRKPADGQ